MNQKLSLHKKVLNMFQNNPLNIFTSGDIVRDLNKNNNLQVEKRIITQILTRLYRGGLIHRTSTQLKDGFHYSLRNKDKLQKIYDSHLFPYSSKGTDKIIQVLKKDNLLSITNKKELNFQKPFQFFQKYSSKLIVPENHLF